MVASDRCDIMCHGTKKDKISKGSLHSNVSVASKDRECQSG